VKRARLRHAGTPISLLVLDVDGVLTDGRLYFGRARRSAQGVSTCTTGTDIAQLRRAGVAGSR